MAEFQTTMQKVLQWLLDMFSDLVGLFLEYPFMGFLMLAGLIYLCIDSVLLIFSGHGSANMGKATLKKSASMPLRSGSLKFVSFGKSPAVSGSVRFDSGGKGVAMATVDSGRPSAVGGSGYSSVTGGKAFLKDVNVGKIKKKKKKKKNNEKEKDKQEQAQQNAFSNGYILGVQDNFGQHEETTKSSESFSCGFGDDYFNPPKIDRSVLIERDD